MRRSFSALAAALVACLAPATARADIESQLAAYEAEARQLATDLPQPGQRPGGQGPRRLVDAQVAYALGDYDTAALMLYDLASKPGSDQETATFYLAESLFQKGDRGAARAYYEQVVAANQQTSPHYQPSLVRLVEIAIAQRDTTNVADTLAALDRLSPAVRKPDVTYVRGKYAFFEGKYDDALAYFQDVPKGSPLELQALYYSATTQVAKQDLARATELFTDLIGRTPKSANDRRVIELGQLALGRLYYERGQPSKSIDSYLMIDRKSDLFSDALYEVAWVYVKGKQYDKALRALELLALSDPTSTKTPTVRILEGNLRIRKAQLIRQAQITGTLDASLKDADPATEYDKAAAVFTETHDQYLPSYLALSRMVDGQTDPGQYLAQLAGRSAGVFLAASPIPEAAAQYLREEPEVQRVVSIEKDLGEIESDIRQSEAILARLDAVVAAGDPSAAYPALQSRRARIGQLADELIKLRAQLADQLAGGSASPATATRRQLVQQYQALPAAEAAHADRVETERASFDQIEQGTAEVAATIDQTQAIAVALRKYAAEAEPALPDDQKTTVVQTLDDAAKEAAALEAELAELQREIQLGRDLAGVGDESLRHAREARVAIKAAQDAEHRQLASAGGNQKLIALADRAARIADNLAQTDAQIEALVQRGLADVKTTIAQERQHLAEMKAELAQHDAESRSVGGSVLAGSFKAVQAKFYDIVIRTDVGNVDVAWAQKEDNDDDLKRLNLQRARELKQLNDEFKDILNPPNVALPPPPRPPAPPAATSPDQGGADRVNPGGEPREPSKPTVKPDTQPTQPKGAPR